MNDPFTIEDIITFVRLRACSATPYGYHPNFEPPPFDFNTWGMINGQPREIFDSPSGAVDLEIMSRRHPDVFRRYEEHQSKFRFYLELFRALGPSMPEPLAPKPRMRRAPVRRPIFRP